ncbi:choice-of-anchor J domain-containing protein [Flavobacterium sp.]|uniref:choice-of-anchor J domain-containing protein n=1 Tax=Flavobacterium sp. TaxID=239 RepID=UPI003D12D12C
MKKITKHFFWKSLVFLAPIVSFAQEEKKDIQYHRCSTVEFEEALRAEHPQMMNVQQFENFLAPHIEKFKADRKSGKSGKIIYNIPVVIHIIHNGDDIGTGENITDAQAISQITVMNNDYRRLAGTPGGANSTGLAVDCEINFVLAKQDPNGNPTTGVVRHNITPYTNAVADGDGGPDWETRADVQTMKTNTQWDPARYLNMWTIRPGGIPLNQGGMSGLLGYAQFPSNSGLTGMQANGGLASTDGVVAGYDVFGTSALNDGSFILNPTYDLGRTMTHEVGHWLGLRHIWGDDACPTVDLTNNNTNEDFCADTPAAAAANYKCTANTDSCKSIPGLDMIQNYMDYTPDSCMDTFTNDQKTRMQTVMQVADRRGSLNISQVATITKAGIYFKQEKNTYTYTEANNCNYTDVTYKVSILKAPSANAVITFNVASGTTAVRGIDFELMTPSVTFNTGDVADKTFTLRYYNDAVKDANKIVKIGMTVNNNGGDAQIINAYTNCESPSILTTTLKDNISTPSTTYENVVFSENFDGAVLPAVITTDRDGDTKNWGFYNATTTSNTIGFTGRHMGSRSWETNPLTPDNLITFSNAIAVPNGNAKLRFNIASNDATYFEEHYAVYITTTTNASTIITNAPVLEETLSKGRTLLTKEIDLSAFLGQNIYLSFRHFNCTDQNFLMVDNIKVIKLLPVDVNYVQTTVNSATKYQSNVNQTGIAYATDATSGKIMADLTNNSNFNYGCTSVNVNRDQATAGAAAVNYGANTATNAKVMAKTFIITPTNNNPSGNEKVAFYFTEAEIAAWETATGNSRTNLKIIKDGVNTPISVTLGNYGTNITLTGNVTNGFNGTYYFGTTATLSNKQEEFESFNIYPNPSEDNFTVQLTSQEAKIEIKVNDISGREIFNQDFENDGIFNHTLRLGQLQNGIYLISVTDGTKKSVRRIIKK